jgi:hypothetical protein
MIDGAESDHNEILLHTWCIDGKTDNLLLLQLITNTTTTASDGSFDNGVINAGSTASAMVKGQGDIQYHCNIHPWMHRSLQVSS